MHLNKLSPAPGSIKERKRVGRGNASGHGGTSGRGTKGAGARSGTKSRFHSEGGQMPIYRRLPKRGFTNIFKEEYQIVNLATLARLQLETVNPEILKAKGVIKNAYQPVKILGQGTLTTAIKVQAHAFSASAREKITAAGGKAETI
jgi:large subunit ribosomal protein L15